LNGTAHSRYEEIEAIRSVNEKLTSELRKAGVDDGASVRIDIGNMVREGLKLW
jgi:hypothetical protein